MIAFPDAGTSRIRSWPDIETPQSNRKACHNATQAEDGGESYVLAQLNTFDSTNHLPAAKSISAHQKVILKRLRRQQFVTEFLRLFSFATLKVSGNAGPKRRRWYHIVGALLFGSAALAGSIVSNVVLSDYVLRSSSDLFANDPFGASLFALMTFFASTGIKAYERHIRSERLRSVYAAVFFALGIGFSAAWVISSAIAFAPDLASSTSWLTASSGSGAHLSVILLISTMIGDIGWSFINLSGAERVWFGKHPVRAIPNPRYMRLTSELSVLHRATDDAEERLWLADDYLARGEQARELTRRAAEFDLARARTLWEQKQVAYRASAIEHFLNPET